DNLKLLESEVIDAWPIQAHAERPSGSGMPPIMERGWNIVTAMDEGCKVLDLRSARKQIRAIYARLEMFPLTYNDLSRMLQELRRRVIEDLEDKVFFCIPYDRVDRFFERSKNGDLEQKTSYSLFGEQSCNAFPSSIRDIEEAAKCLVVGRSTASVFHLMRVMEIGLRSLA